MPGRIAGFLSSVIGRLGSWAGQMASAGARGARGMFNAVVNGLAGLPGRVASVGSNIVRGIWSGISGAAGWLAGKVRSFAHGILDGMKSALGIHSPSRLFRDEVGRYLAQGIGVGFEDEMQAVTQQMAGSIPTSFDADMSVNTSASNAGGFGYGASIDLVDSFKQALAEMKIELDDEVAGKFVNRTVAKAIYR